MSEGKRLNDGGRGRASDSGNGASFTELDGLPAFLRADELAHLLRTTRGAVYALVERGEAPEAHRLGRRLLFEKSAVLRWLDEKRAVSRKGSR